MDTIKSCSQVASQYGKTENEKAAIRLLMAHANGKTGVSRMLASFSNCRSCQRIVPTEWCRHIQFGPYCWLVKSIQYCCSRDQNRVHKELLASLGRNNESQPHDGCASHNKAWDYAEEDFFQQLAKK